MFQPTPHNTASTRPLTIVIVGGVAGGASAAARARRLNEQARIILIEKDHDVSFANCGLPYYIGGEITDRNKLLVATPQKFREWFNIDVRTHQEVKSIDAGRKVVEIHERDTGKTYEESYDKLILSPGASPIVPPLEGVKSRNVFTLRNLADTDAIKACIDGDGAGTGAGGGGGEKAKKRNAVVIGAGFIGLEMVEMLHRRGMHISLVEMQPQVLPPLDREMARIVEGELEKHGVELHLGNGLKSLETAGELVTQVVLADETRLAADLVIMAIGVRPNVSLATAIGLELGKTGGIAVNEFMQTSAPDIYAVGDAVEYRHGVADMLMRVPLAGPANRAGRIAGEHAAVGQAPPMQAVLGTAIVRIFDKVAAVTGCNDRCNAMTGRKARSVWVPANDHASYYPGAKEMLVKLIYDPETNRVIGAQIVGGPGVDKRIDVIATTIRFGGTVEDLTSLDLAYAPPFSSAKDPVHMAGFVAENDLRELCAVTRPDAVEAMEPNVQVVDVRTASEWDAGHLDRATHIPLPELRQRMGELDPTRPVVTICRGGQRGYLAARILKQNSFADVSNMTGGMLLWNILEKSATATSRA